MRLIFLAAITVFSLFHSKIYSQTANAPKLFAHKVIVEEILQTKNYTYLRVKERIKDVDSIQWMAAPLFEPTIGATYYFQSGLQMGEFHSTELDRTFKEIVFLSSISSNPEIGGVNLLAGLPVAPAAPADTTHKAPAVVHTVVVKEVLPAGGYTYLRVKEGDKEEWLAVVKVKVTPGQTLTFDDFGMMTDWTSKELNRTFKEVLLVAKLKLKPGSESIVDDSQKNKSDKESANKNDLKIKHVKDVTSIAKLLEDKKSYSGKTVKVKGKVTKYSSNILGSNWIHIEDGTSFSGKNDLTITIDKEVKVGDLITAEGKISLDKDFGSGYFFDVIMQDADILDK